MSAETFDYHHGKHHNAYVTKLNAMVEGSSGPARASTRSSRAPRAASSIRRPSTLTATLGVHEAQRRRPRGL